MAAPGEGSGPAGCPIINGDVGLWQQIRESRWHRNGTWRTSEVQVVVFRRLLQGETQPQRRVTVQPPPPGGRGLGLGGANQLFCLSLTPSPEERGGLNDYGGDAEAVSETFEMLSEDERNRLLAEVETVDTTLETFDATPRLRTAAAPIRYGQVDVRWVRDDRNAPDYRHLPTDAAGTTFDLAAADLDLLIAANRFAPHLGSHQRIVFALRGCRLVGPGHPQQQRTTLRLQDARPNHRDFRCEIGVKDKSTGKPSAFTASTMPNAMAVLGYYERVNFGAGKPLANMLPTGCYELCVGTHYGSAQVPGVLRLGHGPGPAQAGEATVLRTPNGVIFGNMDVWDRGRPADNIHPAFGTGSFSSNGCLTVRGSYRVGGGHTVEWASFRAAVGIGAGIDNGTRFDLLLLTGLDAATVATMREAGAPQADIEAAVMGLRHGSTGPEVAVLQRKLGLNSSGNFDPVTKRKPAGAQTAALGFATGIHSRDLDADLDLNVLA